MNSTTLPITVVIICKNAAATILHTITQAKQLTPLIIVADTGSTDGTVQLLQQHNIAMHSIPWHGFGPTKNLANALATTPWILSLDADEAIDEQLCNSIRNINFTNVHKVYAIPYLNYIGSTPLHYGEWSGDKHIRLFHKQHVQWNNNTVHEQLIIPSSTQVTKLTGYIHHSTSPTIAAMRHKMDGYARYNAKHYYDTKKKGAYIKKYTSTIFNFILNYIMKLGFADGMLGLQVALENARYTYKKYNYLQQLNKGISID